MQWQLRVIPVAPRNADGHASSEPRFEDFTFDHVLSGTVVGCRRDNKELFAIRVEDNEVSREVMVRADPRYVDYPPLPYEAVIDREDDYTRRRRRRPLPEESSKVVPLARRQV